MDSRSIKMKKKETNKEPALVALLVGLVALRNKNPAEKIND